MLVIPAPDRNKFLMGTSCRSSCQIALVGTTNRRHPPEQPEPSPGPSRTLDGLDRGDVQMDSFILGPLSGARGRRLAGHGEQRGLVVVLARRVAADRPSSGRGHR